MVIQWPAATATPFPPPPPGGPRRSTPMADLNSPKSILEEEIPARVQAKPAFLKEINAIFEFNITGANGGVWTLDLTEAGGGKVTGRASTAEKKTIVTVGDADFINIINKKTNTQMA